MDSSSEYHDWFRQITSFSPHPWQAALAAEHRPRDRLIRIPTGFGKTAGVVLAWLYHRAVRRDEAWPCRLVLTLPMRVLVEQIEKELCHWLARARELALEQPGRADPCADIPVHVLMGGMRGQPWVSDPEAPAILLGTQDMLLSRALNRGYGAARGRWPMEFALLNQDVLWVLDEVQLMDVGLTTSAQLAAFRADDAAARPWLRPAVTWWMSATLQPRWLDSVDAAELVAPLAEHMLEIPAEGRSGGLWTIRKPAERRADISTAADIAALARARHTPGTLTLVIVNRVEQAVQIHDSVRDAYSQGKGTSRRLGADAPELCLIHSRFRGMEREAWSQRFLRRDAPLGANGRIIVATQVIEAGVDISAALLISELAPWSSLVQRAGRAARYPGERATIIVVGAVPQSSPAGSKDALPYEPEAMIAADQAWNHLLERGGDASLHALTELEDTLARNDDGTDLLTRLYPYIPAQVLQRTELDQLFDTAPDLSGADLDISPFIRSGDDRDVSLVWRTLDTSRRRIERGQVHTISRRELCPAPVAQVRKWLEQRGDRNKRAYVFQYLEGQWVEIEPRRLVPGSTVLISALAGGYDPERGFEPKSTAPVAELPADPVAPAETEQRFVHTAAAEGDDSASIAMYKTIATHGGETATIAGQLCQALGISDTHSHVLALAARWHDAGKAHTVFQDAIIERERSSRLASRRDLAKAPESAWRRPQPYPDRPGFRHELASTLALFALLRRARPEHPALLGPHRALLEAAGIAIQSPPDDERIPADHPLAAELAELDADSFDLLAYLVCSHHGKVRCSWTSTPGDQRAGHGGIHGLCNDDRIDNLMIADRDGAARELPSLAMHLDAAAIGVGGRYGASWSERVARLRARLGPFTLAFLETILRAADQRASQLTTEDPLA